VAAEYSKKNPHGSVLYVRRFGEPYVQKNMATGRDLIFSEKPRSRHQDADSELWKTIGAQKTMSAKSVSRRGNTLGVV